MYVALDRSDGQYFACDAGCLDDPISLRYVWPTNLEIRIFNLLSNCCIPPISEKKTMFPVKLTEPLTAILYIASDKEHIEELQHAIHVQEVIEGKQLMFK